MTADTPRCAWCECAGGTGDLQPIPGPKGATGQMHHPWEAGGYECRACGVRAPLMAWYDAWDWLGAKYPELTRETVDEMDDERS